MLQRPRVIFSLSPVSLRVGVETRRGFTRLHRIALDPVEWERSWSDGLRPLDQTLRDALRRVEIEQADVDLVFDSPTQFVDVVSVPLAGRAALKAGELAARENAGSDDHTRRNFVSELAATTSAATGAASTAILICSERESTLESIAAWLERAGLRLSGILPARAIAVREAAESCRSADGRVVLYCGETCTVVVSAGDSPNSIRFVRCIDIGYGMLAEAVVRGAASSDQNIDRRRCLELLMTVGIPARGQIIEPASGLRGEAVLPLMQSVLQRYTVEIKQTLRFSLPESDVSRAKVLLTGAAAHIAGFGGQLAAQLDLDVDCHRGDTHAAAADEEGLLAGFRTSVEQLDPQALVPISTRDSRLERMMARAWRCGVAVAVLALAGLAATAVGDRERIAKERTELDARMSIMAEERASRRRADALATALLDSRAMIAEQMGSSPSWSAVLAAVSRAVGDGVTLSDLAASFPIEMRKQPVLTIRGAVRSLPASESEDPLAAFLARLNGDPITAAAHLVSTRAVLADDEEIRHFQIAIPLAGEPAGSSGPVAAAAGGAS